MLSCPANGILNQLYTLRRVVEGAWEFTQPVNCVKCVLWIWRRYLTTSLEESCGGVLRDYGESDPLIWAVCSLYDQSQSLVHRTGSNSDSFLVRVGDQGCPLSPILFITFLDRMRGSGVETSESSLGFLRMMSSGQLHPILIQQTDPARV